MFDVRKTVLCFVLTLSLFCCMYNFRRQKRALQNLMSNLQMLAVVQQMSLVNFVRYGYIKGPSFLALSSLFGERAGTFLYKNDFIKVSDIVTRSCCGLFFVFVLMVVLSVSCLLIVCYM